MVTMTALMCLATAVFFEARAEPIDGQLMVAETIMNRVEDSRYPNKVCDVVYEKHAFSFTEDGKSDNMRKYNSYYDAKARNTALLIAKEALHRTAPMTTATHYHEANIYPFWTAAYKLDGQIGQHIFYTNETPYK